MYIYIWMCMYLYLHIYIGLKRLTVDVKSVFKTIQTSGFWMRSVESDFWTERKIALVLHFFGLTTDVYIYFYISYLHICINIYMCVFVPISTIICLNACISLNLCIYIYSYTCTHTYTYKTTPHTPEPPDKHRFHMINPTGDFDLNMCSFHMKSVQCKGQFLTMWSKHWVCLSIGSRVL
jgi:hypothetical protein